MPRSRDCPQFARRGFGDNPCSLRSRGQSQGRGCPQFAVARFLRAGRILVALLLTVSAAWAGTGTVFEDCFVKQTGDTLSFGNSRIVRTYAVRGTGLAPLTIENKDSGFRYEFDGKKQEYALGAATNKALGSEWRAWSVPETAIIPSHLSVEVIDAYAGLQVKRAYRIYPNCPAIGCDFYLRKTAGPPLEFAPEETVLQALPLSGKHWKFDAIEFFDRTDGNNTLVKPTSTSLFSSGQVLRGNILIAANLVAEQGLFFVKEAPCSFVQLAYPGFDFSCAASSVSVAGIGVTPADLVENQWIPAYGVVTGVWENSKLDCLASMRDYQKRQRKYVPERDDMVMMNTWGDRNQDAMISESFIMAQVDACAKLGVSVLQIDDGWQQGLSRNSASGAGKLWDQWDAASWQPNKERFPNGFAPVVEYARERGVALGLWFHPSNANDYANWKQDAAIVAGIFRDYGVQYFKIDGVKLNTKQAELNFRKFLDTALDMSGQRVFFNLDATADNRGGYHYLYHYGNIFLENRYTTKSRSYVPHWTLRNLWMLSKYVAPERLQIEFLNKWRNADVYDAGDPFAPQAIPFEYEFAITMMAQPLAWFEGSNLPEEGFAAAPVIKKYRGLQAELHRGCILPIGEEPSGRSWTGFQSIRGMAEGYVLVFRENTPREAGELACYLPAGSSVTFDKVLGSGDGFSAVPDAAGRVTFQLPSVNSYALYAYEVAK